MTLCSLFFILKKNVNTYPLIIVNGSSLSLTFLLFFGFAGRVIILGELNRWQRTGFRRLFSGWEKNNCSVTSLRTKIGGLWVRGTVPGFGFRSPMTTSNFDRSFPVHLTKHDYFVFLLQKTLENPFLPKKQKTLILRRKGDLQLTPVTTHTHVPDLDGVG